MKPEDPSPGFARDLGEEDEVEILEVVGIEEDSVPSAGSPDEPHEVVLAGDDDREGRAGPAPDARDRSEAAAMRMLDVPALGQEQLLRMRADYENLRKRIDREREDYEQHANSTLVSRLLPVLDNFERALMTRAESGDRAFREGVVLIYRHLLDELRKEGLTAIESLGERFDPTVHDAVATVGAPRQETDRVVEELQRGYLFRNRLLRPALVKVGTAGTERTPRRPEEGS